MRGKGVQVTSSFDGPVNQEDSRRGDQNVVEMNEKIRNIGTSLNCLAGRLYIHFSVLSTPSDTKSPRHAIIHIAPFSLSSLSL
jgi:hypothetical protein